MKTAGLATPLLFSSPFGGSPLQVTAPGVTGRDPFIARAIDALNQQRLSGDIFHLAGKVLPVRKLNLTLPAHNKSTLDEADDYLTSQLERSGYTVTREEVLVQAFRCDSAKPKADQYSDPLPGDPWYRAFNLYAEHIGTSRPDEIILLLAHKDSQSWVDSPGAYDNAVGTAAVVELARVFSTVESRRTIRFLLCNEEHTPWTSVTAARNARQRSDKLAAVFNLDGLGGKSQQDIDAGVKTNVSVYTTDEGKELADLMTQVVEVYDIGLRQQIARRSSPGDDDGSFVSVGYGRTILNIGSFPFVDPQYHREGDTAGRVDIENVCLAARATLAAVLEVDREPSEGRLGR